MSSAVPVPRPAHRTADLVLVGGEVRTMDPAHPHATAIAVDDGKVVAVGSDAEIAPWIDTGTKQIALAGATVTPGLIDAHCHLYGLGVDGESISVRNAATAVAAAELVAAQVSTRAPNEWLIGRGWDQNRWPGQTFPTRATLDAVIADRPVMLRRIDGHAIWVNSKALALANITKATKDPAGGKIVRDAKGEPTGVLIDNAIDLVERVVPAPSPQVRERRILAAAEKAVAAGITGVHEMGIEPETAAVYEKLAREGKLPLRVYALLAGDPSKPEQLSEAPRPAVGRFEMRAVKFFADGALGSRGARLAAPYDDDPKNLGLWVTEPAQLTAAVTNASAHGWQVGVHAIGDAGVGAVLDAFAAAKAEADVRAEAPRELRPRIEHVQVIAPADVERMAAVKAIASMQPTHATSDMPWAEQRLGKQRILGAYAWRTMLDHHIPLAAGSDFPIEEVAPLLGLYAAVTRQDAEGTPAGGWYPAQRLTLDEAIAAFTSGAAYAQFAEHTLGTIAVGRTADLTVFDRPLAADRSLLATGVAYTIVDGAIVYERPKP
ncbi:MAG TPA: amidohydrolase [Kofleriaceae bacterium]|nr:amidohydrolase [Kofleriaceae bacterium]